MHKEGIELNEDGTGILYNTKGDALPLTVDQVQQYYAWMVSKGKCEPDDPWGNEGDVSAALGFIGWR